MAHPLPYVTPGAAEPNRPSTHEIVYRILVIIFGVLVIASGLLVISVLRRAQDPVPNWLIVYLGCCYAAIALCCFAVVAVRALWPGRFRWITKTWNIIMLFLVPLGTALGIYGLIVLDRRRNDDPAEPIA